MGMVWGRQMEPRKLDRRTVRRVAALFKPYGVQVSLTFILVLISAGLSLLTPFFLQRIIDDGLRRSQFAVITSFTLYTLAAVIGSTVASLGFGYLSVLVGQRIMRDLRNSLFEHLQGMSLRFFTGTRTGEIQSRLANDVGGIQSVVSDTAANVLNNFTTVASTIIAMFPTELLEAAQKLAGTKK